MPIENRVTAASAKTQTRRSQGQIVVARSLWYVNPGTVEIRTERLGSLLPGEARIATHFSAISRGTESLIARGEVPEAEWDRMRAPMQTGDFPFPTKYGYAATGVVIAGSQDIVGRRVFVLHPHQDYFQVAEAQLQVVPDGIPLRRAALAANMETALNGHWDAGTALGDRVLVVGAGVVGLLVAYLARQIAGTEVAICDLDARKSRFADALGIAFVAPDAVPKNNRIVFHTTATEAGLATAIDAAAFEGRIVELSWYGARETRVNLGGAFHSQRLQIVASQVGHVAPNHRASVSRRARLGQALRLLDHVALDVLVGDDIAFDAAPQEMARIFSTSFCGGAPLLRYAAAKEN